MLKMIRKLAIPLLAVCLWADPSKADESLLPEPIPPEEISIAEISEVFIVDPTSPEVDPAFVEAEVREYFADIPVMIAIARCESSFQQFQADGSLTVSEARDLSGKRTSSASGVFQILYKMHFEDWAGSPETNIVTLEGNMRFARKLYNESGTLPWTECL